MVCLIASVFALPGACIAFCPLDTRMVPAPSTK
jgi:hypothetical protein